jgi:hypothetical protein
LWKDWQAWNARLAAKRKGDAHLFRTLWIEWYEQERKIHANNFSRSYAKQHRPWTKVERLLAETPKRERRTVEFIGKYEKLLKLEECRDAAFWRKVDEPPKLEEQVFTADDGQPNKLAGPLKRKRVLP